MTTSTTVSMNYTVALLKPDALRRRLVGEIVIAIERVPLTIATMRLVGGVGPENMRRFYAEHEGRQYFPALIGFMTSGPLIAMQLCAVGLDAVTEWRALMGASNPAKREPQTIRGRFAADCPEVENLVHGSDSRAAAVREAQLLWSWRWV